MSDARERRRQRAETEKKADVAGAVKKFRVPIIILIVWAGIIGFNVAQAEGVIEEFGEECPGHWHPVMAVYMDDTELTFSDPSFTQHGTGDAAGFHVHDATGVLHFHPARERCIPLEDAMQHLALEVDGDTFHVGQEYGAMAGDHPINDTMPLRIFVQEWGESRWDEKGRSYLETQPGNGDRILMVYGSDVDVAQLEAAVPQVPENYEPTVEDAGLNDKFVPIMMTTIFAALAMALWYNFAKKTW